MGFFAEFYKIIRIENWNWVLDLMSWLSVHWKTSLYNMKENDDTKHGNIKLESTM